MGIAPTNKKIEINRFVISKIKDDKRKNRGHVTMRTFILAALMVLFSIYGAASAAEIDTFEIEAEGSYRMDADTPVDLAKQVAFFTAQRKAVELAGRYLSRKSHNSLYFT